MILVKPLVSNHSVVVNAFLVHLLISNHSNISFLSIFIFDVNSAAITLKVVNNVDIGPIDIFKCPPVRIHSNAHRSEHTCNLDSITRSHFIYEVFISA